MSAATDAIEALNTVITLLGVSGTKMDQVLVKIQNLNNGGVLTQAELNTIIGLIGQVSASASSVDAKIDQALAI